MAIFTRIAMFFALAVALCLPGVARADDWAAVQLRGVVMAFVNGDWIKLRRGVVIPGDQVIRTLPSGRVTFARGAERIEMGPNTQMQIADRAGAGKFTTVKQHYGQVAVEAEVRAVRHFAVETPHLTAVVKGTRFTVASGRQGARVDVKRGAVAVVSAGDGSSVTIAAGQSVMATPRAGLRVSGRGDLPTVLDKKGLPISDGKDGDGDGKIKDDKKSGTSFDDGKSKDHKKSGTSFDDGKSKDDSKSKETDGGSSSTDSGGGSSSEDSGGKDKKSKD